MLRSWKTADGAKMSGNPRVFLQGRAQAPEGFGMSVARGKGSR